VTNDPVFRFVPMKTIIFFAILCMTSSGFAQCDSITEINSQIIQLVGEKIGTKVGRGECWDLANYVLNEAGADWDGMYKFGRVLKKGECIMPGDIIQFEKLKTEFVNNDVKSSEMFPHHTAIVYQVRSADEIMLVHQNTGYTGKRVGTSMFRFSTITTGRYIIYRPEYL
jgi:hypothetical protein